MNRKLFTITLAALLALLLSVGGATGQEPNPEGEPQPKGEVSITAAVSSRISYQGLLKEDGTPVTDSRDMVFRLYSDSSCTTQVGVRIVKNGVTVTDGLFSVELGVTHSYFHGQGLWLEVEVGGTAIGCQAILPVPYALSLRPGATVGDAASTVQLNHYWRSAVFPGHEYKYGIQGEVSGSHDYAYGVYGVAATTETDGMAYGLYGSATADSGTAYGVYGESESSSGVGVYGNATGSSARGVVGWGDMDGVYGRSNSGTGVVAESDSGRLFAGYDGSPWGLKFYVSNDGYVYADGGVYGTAPQKGVEGHATATSGNTYGVYGQSISSSGWGVYGEAPRYGMYGHATDTSGVPSIGVYGQSDSGVTGRGVVGSATATVGTVYGVYGMSESADGAGVLARGKYGGADLILGADGPEPFDDDGKIFSDPFRDSSDIWLIANDDVQIKLDNDGDGEDADFDIVDRDDNLIFNVDESGTTQVQVLEITGGSDLAEPFEIAGAEPIAPGMVVAIDPQHPGQLRIADQAYDRTVVGCVSGANGVNPGLTMQQEGIVAEGALPVALSGRVYCWADASYGSIQPGDLLTTSDTSGHVMKVSDYEMAQGAIIGKAMTALEKGRSLILVLVTLQ